MASTIPKFAPFQIPLSAVLKATNNFHHDNIISQGDFGPAYKGQLLRARKLTKIVARRLDRKRGLGDAEFWTEVSVLSELEHTNLVSMIGYCDEKGEKIIITTYQANGSVAQFIKSPIFTWTQRLKVCVGVARALSYLHSPDKKRDYVIIHRNVNSCTILLDENWEAKLSGFEISVRQSIHQKGRVLLSEPIGVMGYMDPATEKARGVIYKSDIYSFGVVLFEILCGREAFIQNEADGWFLTLWAIHHYENKTLQDVIDAALRNRMSLQSFTRYSKVAYSCIEKEPVNRPDMGYIVTQLENTVELELRLENLKKNLDHLKIRFKDIQSATKIFSKAFEIGDDGFCILYRVGLDHFDKEKISFIDEKNKVETPKRHNTVIIKRIYARDDKPREDFFLTEIEMLTSVKHHGIITLLGFCVEGPEMIIVTENVSNGYLGDYLGNVNGMRTLTWEKRLKICIDVAHALNYIHSKMKDQKIIINRDIKSDNIGLDDDWRAKIANFGFSLFLPPNQEDKALYLNTIVGTIPFYIDPEYFDTGKLKRESDVYSFGVILFEILCGRRANDPIYDKESDKGLASVARQRFSTGTLKKMIDPMLNEETDENNYIVNRGPTKNSLDAFIRIAYKCVAENQSQRPTMEVVIKNLEKALIYQDKQVPHRAKFVGLPLTHKNITLEEKVQPPNRDQVVNKLEKAQGFPLTCEAHGNNLKIPLRRIKLATDDFSNTYKIGFTEYHTLYRVRLDHFDIENPSYIEGKNKGNPPKRHNNVIIKRILPRNDEHGEQAFHTEIKMLMNVKHCNIVKLLGFCAEGSEMILVIDNVSNGYLGDYLENVNGMRRTLTWEKRLKICIDIAHALNYLHFEMEDQKMIINRDIRSHNIGLDENWGAKISDFSLSVLLPQNQQGEALYLNTIAGTETYIDPDYEKTFKLKTESDVYSFGVVLFEILYGRTSFDSIYHKRGDKGLASAARRSYKMKTLVDMIDPLIKEEMGENTFILTRGPNKDSLHTFIEIAYQCVAETQDQRPRMNVVVKELEKALTFQENNKDNPKIRLEEIKLATQNFHVGNCIGRGGFGKVYKGELRDGHGFKAIVAKRLDKRSDQGEQQFFSELQILLEYKHENIIGLVGYCLEEDEKIIVYEYESRKSLNRYLNDASLTWMKRLNICIEVASALDFLHGGVGKQAKVVHRDIKSSNILLNDDWKAKLSDFGLSLISPITQESDYIIDRACGTKGYVDPLYRKSGFLSIESDIYSFGVVMFEILCGRSTFTIKENEGYHLSDFIKKSFEEGKHDEVVFKQIREQIVPKSLTTFQKIAYQCLHHERENRPTTKEIVTELKKALEFQTIASTWTKFAPLQIPLKNIVKATNNFHHDNIIGQSNFGTAYKGRLLRFGKLMKIAAKTYECYKHGEGDLEFFKEISVLSNLKHTNIVTLIGYCDEKDKMIIVTTYESKGSLRQYLKSGNLTWTQGLRICVGLARAVSYLHREEGRDYVIIHCNINSDTILLDENWDVKLSGFEMHIKQLVCYKDHVCFCKHIGSTGYMDPEIEKTGGVTHKDDIYSLGVVLFEILCGGSAFIQNEDSRFIAPLAIYHYENETLPDIIYRNLLNQMSLQALSEYSKVAYSCLKKKRTQRPDADNIVDTLEKALDSQLQHENKIKNFEHLKIDQLRVMKLSIKQFFSAIRNWGYQILYFVLLMLIWKYFFHRREE